jgi:hypothetical protein
MAIEVGHDDFLDGVGCVRRLWHTVTDPNVLAMNFNNGRARYDLKVWSPDQPGDKDLFLHF